MGPPPDFFQRLADFYAILAEIRNCPGVTPTIRLQSLPSHRVACRERGRRRNLVPCLDLFEADFLLSHHQVNKYR